ncbi:MAG: regulatory iron-sulfur-containing complex subunit RicT [Spirochaetales bacterium]
MTDELLETPLEDEGKVVTVKLEQALFLVKILHSSETELCDPRGEMYRPGEYLVVDTRYGKDLAEMLGMVKEYSLKDTEGNNIEVFEVVRRATAQDLALFEENKGKEKEAYRVCREKIQQHNLDMKLVSAHYMLDENKILFFFTADARVDFRDLVKDLVAHFKTRIELRQIGVRDEARVVGGVGVCGRILCCHSITDKLCPVSIKMAKLQNMSLNSVKISGPCGRLLCCLAYEYGLYQEERKKIPSEGTKISYEGTVFKVIDLNVLKGLVRFLGEDGRLLEIPASRLRYDSERSCWIIQPLSS